MEFKQCETFKCLRAEGKKGIYFISESAWCHLSVCVPESTIPETINLGAYHDVSGAIAEAEEIDEDE